MSSNKKLISNIVSGFIGGLFSLTAVAGYTGPAGEPLPTIAAEVPQQGDRFFTVESLNRLGHDDLSVVLEGYIVLKHSEGHYLFSDGTGEIELETDAESWPAADINETTRVKVYGVIDAAYYHPEKRDYDIEVEKIEIVSEK
jgi:uncharacterized protein (TIGR00156 family)